MKVTKLGNNQYLVRLVIGEEVIQSLKEFATKYLNNQFASITGIGAVKNLLIGYYKDFVYLNQEFNDEYEVLSLNGNISIRENERFSHVHIVFAGKDYIAHGGHLFKATVSATLEIVVQAFDVEIHRNYDDTSKLYLLD
ncbi:MAG TPA: DUF296 domain-containing protein [Bacilli bacterium]|nr:DUF296 domain-containing protein [Bacilli bacterium]